nr:hypothetical protein [Tanacetum cinerariifolium]
LKASGSVEDLELIQEEDTNPFVGTSLNHEEDDKKLMNLKVISIPFVAALLDLESKKWLDAMNMEMQSMKGNDVWVLVELPPNARTVGSKWLFKKKTDIDGVEAVWICKFISGLGIVPTIKEPISMYCENTKAIEIAKDDEVTKGARHFHAKVYYFRETIKLGDVKIEKIDTDDNLADLFSKALEFPKHYELTRNIRLLPASSFM